MIEYMREILRCHFRRTRNTIVLRDNETRVSITDLPRGGIFFKVPENHKGHIRFVKGYKKTCDYLLLIPRDDDEVDIYFIELKKSIGLDEKEKACEQIICTIPILDYLISIIENPHGRKLINSPKRYLHFAVLGNPTPTKPPKLFPKLKPIDSCEVGEFGFVIIYSTKAPIPIKSLEYPPEDTTSKQE